MLFKIDCIDIHSGNSVSTEYVKSDSRKAVEDYFKNKICGGVNLDDEITRVLTITRVVTTKESFIFGTKEKYAFSLSKEIYKKYGPKIRVKLNPGQEYEGLDKYHFQELTPTEYKDGVLYCDLGDILYRLKPDEAKEAYSNPGNYVPKLSLKTIETKYNIPVTMSNIKSMLQTISTEVSSVDLYADLNFKIRTNNKKFILYASEEYLRKHFPNKHIFEDEDYGSGVDLTFTEIIEFFNNTELFIRKACDAIMKHLTSLS